MSKATLILALFSCCSADCGVGRQQIHCSPKTQQEDQDQDEVSLLQIAPYSPTQKLETPSHDVVLAYAKKVHDTKVSAENPCTMDTVLFQVDHYYKHLYPNATVEKVWHRDIARCVASAHRLMLRHQLNSSEKGANDPEIYATMHHIDKPVEEFEKKYPPTGVIDSVASFCGVHYVDLENMIRAKFHKPRPPLKNFAPTEIARHWKSVVTDLFQTYGDLYGKIDNPFEAAALCASAHVFMINDQIDVDTPPAAFPIPGSTS